LEHELPFRDHWLPRRLSWAAKPPPRTGKAATAGRSNADRWVTAEG